MESNFFINVTLNETRMAITENGIPVELYIERKSHPRVVGNIYKGKVGKIVPGMQAAFIDLGLGKSGFISVEDVQEDSYFEFFLEEEDPKSQKQKSKSLIQDMLREGQEVLVQCLKEFSGGKGAKLSTNIALPGKYVVLLGNTELIGVSRRIEDLVEKKRLQDFIKQVKPKGVGFIARTASKGVNQDEIEKEIKYLITIWDEIIKKSEEMKSPNLLYEEPSLHIRAVRDLITDEVRKIIVDSREAYKDLKDYMKSNFPETKIQIDLYSDSTPLFIKHDVEPEIEKLLDNRVWLKSGGYLIIEETEALTVIDINSGRYTKGYDQEETIFNINMEAAREAAHQIRLRNLVGIIVIDFIDLKSRQKREEIFNAFTEELKKDKARSVIMKMSSFGVVQMTRQRFRESLLTSISEPCFYCEGNGYLKSIETTSYEIIRELRRLSSKQLIKKIIIIANPNLISIIKEIEGHNLKQFEQQHSLELIFESKDCKLAEFEIKTL